MNPLHYDPPPIEALFADRRPRLRAATLEELDKIVENSSEKNRNFFIAYLGLLVYVQAIVFATTDLQLLVPAEGLKMPIIDLTVPLTGFYVVVPVFVIALHFNFLQNLESHHYKLMRWKDAHPGGIVPRSRIQPFLFDYATLETGSQMERMVRWANSLLVLNLAPITLGLLLWRFTDRQDWSITVWHYLAFVFDSYLVWKLRLALIDNDRPQIQKHSPFSLRYWLLSLYSFLRDIPRHGLRGGFGLLVSLQTILAGLIVNTNNEDFLIELLPYIRKLTGYTVPNPPGVIETSRGLEKASMYIELLLPRLSIDPAETLWKGDINALESAAKLAGQSDSIQYFREHGDGFRPAPSSLRLINVPKQNLPRAQLSTLSMEGANFAQAQLQGANLSGAGLGGGEFAWANLQGADLSVADLRNVNFSGSILRNANMSGTQLQGSHFFLAQMREADLRMSEMQGANLVWAKMVQANLEQAHLQDSNLLEAIMLGANLSGAEMQGTKLIDVEMQGCNLSYAHMQGANLSGSQLQGVSLESASLQGANLSGAGLQGANLSRTELQGADLSKAKMQGAILDETDIRFATNIPSASVFDLSGSGTLFSNIMPDWQEIEKIGETIHNTQVKQEFRLRIQQAKALNPKSASALQSESRAIPKGALLDACGNRGKYWNFSKDLRLASVLGFRNAYFALQKNRDFMGFEMESGLKKNPEFRQLLQAIDRALCTLPACADLKDGLEGLDCRPFLEAKPQASSKH